MNPQRRAVLATLAAGGLSLACGPSFAQKLAGGKVVRIVTPVAPGGTVDVLARQLARRLADVLGQTVIVENKPGGAGTIAGTYVASSAPDGTTLLLGSLDLATLPALSTQKNFVPMQQLAPVTLVSTGCLTLVVNAEKTPAKTLAELIADAKAHPGNLTFGSAGPGNVTHLFAEVFKRAAGIDIRHIAYKGTGPALTDLQGGQITMIMAGPSSVKELVASGRLRALAVTGKEPGSAAGLGNTPTFSELGFRMPETDFGAWQGLFVPRGTPADVVATLNQSVHAVLGQPEIRSFMSTIAISPLPSTPEGLGEVLAAQTQAWGQVIRQAGITPS